MKTEYINPHHFILEIEASGGTYIKEFVHGDLGRTRPNVGEILVWFRCDSHPEHRLRHSAAGREGGGRSGYLLLCFFNKQRKEIKPSHSWTSFQSWGRP